MKSISKHSVFRFLGALALIAIAGVWIAFHQMQKEDLCSEVIVKIYSRHGLDFVNRSKVEKILRDAHGDNPIRKKLTDLDLNLLETALRNSSFIKDANVYTQIDGKLVAEVWQREPIIRIQTDEFNGYYLDVAGDSFALSPDYSARVMVATGTIDRAMVRKLYTVALTVQENPFWLAQIEQIFVSEQKDLILIPKIGSCELVLGNTDRLEEKLNDLKGFMRDGLGTIGWSKYKSISVKYKDQIICKP
jgi:cell division protein FtsQ